MSQRLLFALLMQALLGMVSNLPLHHSTFTCSTGKQETNSDYMWIIVKWTWHILYFTLISVGSFAYLRTRFGAVKTSNSPGKNPKMGSMSSCLPFVIVSCMRIARMRRHKKQIFFTVVMLVLLDLACLMNIIRLIPFQDVDYAWSLFRDWQYQI